LALRQPDFRKIHYVPAKLIFHKRGGGDYPPTHLFPQDLVLALLFEVPLVHRKLQFVHFTDFIRIREGGHGTR
jgi:hypothetical protein